MQALKAIVALEKQIRVPHSQTASIGLAHPNVVLMQQYLALSPKCEEILTNWKHGNDVRIPLRDILRFEADHGNLTAQKHATGGSLYTIAYDLDQSARIGPLLSTDIAKHRGKVPGHFGELW